MMITFRRTVPWILCMLPLLENWCIVQSFSASNVGGPGKYNDETDASFTLFDRFRSVCPADIESIRNFESSLVGESDPSDIWVAVYRSSNNKPSVLIKDDFLKAMRSATNSINTITTDPAVAGSFSKKAISAPVAVARLRRDCTEAQETLFLDSMRCILLKENTDAACDGGSEHTEALATAIDALLHHYLVSMMDSSHGRFEGIIRTKATLVSAVLLEERGFAPVQRLCKDMITHTSSLDHCLERYAARSVSADSRSPGARQRSIDIVSQLGRIDREFDLSSAQQKTAGGENDEEEYDPWASVKGYF